MSTPKPTNPTQSASGPGAHKQVIGDQNSIDSNNLTITHNHAAGSVVILVYNEKGEEMEREVIDRISNLSRVTGQNIRRLREVVLAAVTADGELTRENIERMREELKSSNQALHRAIKSGREEHPLTAIAFRKGWPRTTASVVFLTAFMGLFAARGLIAANHTISISNEAAANKVPSLDSFYKHFVTELHISNHFGSLDPLFVATIVVTCVWWIVIQLVDGAEHRIASKNAAMRHLEVLRRQKAQFLKAAMPREASEIRQEIRMIEKEHRLEESLSDLD